MAPPAATRHRVDEVVGSGRPTVVCAHRENLPVLLEEASAVLGAKPPDGEPLPMAGFWVLHIGWSALICAERHHALAGRHGLRPQPRPAPDTSQSRVAGSAPSKVSSHRFTSMPVPPL